MFIQHVPISFVINKTNFVSFCIVLSRFFGMCKTGIPKLFNIAPIGFEGKFIDGLTRKKDTKKKV